MTKQILLVGLGGAAGSVLRYLTSVLTERFYAGLFPLATLLVNILGCFLIGLLLGAFGQNAQNGQDLRLLFITGFCGGYTTFSTFALENITLVQNNHIGLAVLYITLSVIAGLSAVWLGITVMR